MRYRRGILWVRMRMGVVTCLRVYVCRSGCPAEQGDSLYFVVMLRNAVPVRGRRTSLFGQWLGKEL